MDPETREVVKHQKIIYIKKQIFLLTSIIEHRSGYFSSANKMYSCLKFEDDMTTYQKNPRFQPKSCYQKRKYK